MSEIVAKEIVETTESSIASENFDPDKRIDIGKTELDTKDTLDTKDFSEIINSFDPDKRVDINPYSNIPKDGVRGKWEGSPGDSKYIPDEKNAGGPPSGKDVKDALSAKEKDGIEYHKGEPDFSKVAEATVQIKDMSDVRYGPDGNFAKADQKLADQYNSEKHEGRDNWSARDIKDYRQSKLLTWHERQDCTNMDLVNRDIHQYFSHTGGVAFCKARNNSEVKFDE